ncbi:MAG: lipocalin family protein [Chitinophagaceae bacterium]|nr:lipocalin family protein [Chitinophagaceae bacterium]
MLKQIFKTVPLLAITIVLFVSCSKDDDPVTTKTKTELIGTGTWKFSSATVSGADVSMFIQACQKDNVLMFAVNGTGAADEGAAKCNGADPQVRNFTWNFASSETILHVSTVFFTGGSSDFTVVSLTETQLVLSQNVTISGSTQNAVVTFIH